MPQFSQVVGGAALGNNLSDLLLAEDIQPGDSPSYQICKTIYAYHPLGAKMADAPIDIAQSQARKISVPKGPEERLVEAFEAEWLRLYADALIKQVASLSRVYGVASIALLMEGVPENRPVDYNNLAGANIAFNVLDPLNTSGSLVLDQNPNRMAFQKVKNISVSGVAYHPSRTRTLMNEAPLYIEYTTSAFGYVGRSVYQRALFPLKSFVQTMVTDDMVSLKAGVLIAMVKAAGSIITRAMAAIAGLKRSMIKEAQTNNVISINIDEKIESLNLQNIDGAFGAARKNILDNIATAGSMPAIILNQETFAEGFGEGVEDSKRVSQYVDGIRKWMGPLYEFMSVVCMYRAWSRDFYKVIQADFPEEYGKKGYTQAFYDWRNSYSATWPSLIEEPDSEKIKVEDVKLKAAIAAVQVYAPMLDPENKALALKWCADVFNAQKMLFPTPLELDWEALASYEPPAAEGAGDNAVKAPPPFSGRDSSSVAQLTEAVGRLPDLNQRRRVRAAP